MAKNQEWARYLEKDGEVRLFGSEQIEDARGDGWKEPTRARGNGEPWNPEVIEGEGEPAAESQAIVAKGREKIDQARTERLNKQAEEQAKLAEDSRASIENQPDFKVEVIEPAKATKTTAKKSAK